MSLAKRSFATDDIIFHTVFAGINSRLSGSASNLALAGKSSLTTARTRGLSAGKTGLAGQRNGLMAKSWSDLSLSAVNTSPSPSPLPRDAGLLSLHHYVLSAFGIKLVLCELNVALKFKV